MSAAAKSLILKAQDNIDTAKKFIDDETQHDVVGYNLAQATEFLLKALCSLRNVDFPEDEQAHDLDALMEALEENNFPAVSSHADVIELNPYNNARAVIRKSERLNLKEYLGHVEDLKKLVGQQL